MKKIIFCFLALTVNTSAMAMNISTHGMASKRALHQATLLKDGNVLLTGGVSSLWPIPWTLSSAEIFDPIQNRFFSAYGMHDYHTEHAATLLPNGNVVISGGNRSAVMELFNSKTYRFEKLKAPLSARAGHTAHLIDGHKLFMLGGYFVKINFAQNSDPQNDFIPLESDQRLLTPTFNKLGFELVPLKTCEVYDLNTQTAYEIPYPPYFSRLTMHRSLTLPNGNILIVGGMGNRENMIELDTKTETFRLFGKLKEPREDQAMLFLNDNEILISGGTNAKAITTPSFEIINLQSGIASLLEIKMHEPREDHQMIHLQDGRIVLVGGEIHGEPDQILKSVEVLDLKTNTIEISSNLFPQGKSDHQSTLLKNGSLLMTGGEEISGSISRAAYQARF